MRKAIRRVLGAYTGKICVCEKCGKRVRLRIGSEAHCHHCRKKVRPASRAY